MRNYYFGNLNYRSKGCEAERHDFTQQHWLNAKQLYLILFCATFSPFKRPITKTTLSLMLTMSLKKKKSQKSQKFLMMFSQLPKLSIKITWSLRWKISVLITISHHNPRRLKAYVDKLMSKLLDFQMFNFGTNG